MKRLNKKQLDQKVNEVFSQHCNGIQFNILDLSKVSRMIELAIQSGQDGVDAAKKAAEQYGVKNK